MPIFWVYHIWYKWTPTQYRPLLVSYLDEALEDSEPFCESYFSTVSKMGSVYRQRDSPRADRAAGFARWQVGVTNAKVGAHGARETPVPIPNTVVKPRSGYNTWGPPLGK